tara:strand:+ start:57 stop:209 length:153 start_codon:yes stop_codon:yes gene_type:complete
LTIGSLDDQTPIYRRLNSLKSDLPFLQQALVAMADTAEIAMAESIARTSS